MTLCADSWLLTGRDGRGALNIATKTVRDYFAQSNFTLGNTGDLAVILSKIIADRNTVNHGRWITYERIPLAGNGQRADQAQCIQRKLFQWLTIAAGIDKSAERAAAALAGGRVDEGIAPAGVDI